MTAVIAEGIPKSRGDISTYLSIRRKSYRHTAETGHIQPINIFVTDHRRFNQVSVSIDSNLFVVFALWPEIKTYGVVPQCYPAVISVESTPWSIVVDVIVFLESLEVHSILMRVSPALMRHQLYQRLSVIDLSVSLEELALVAGYHKLSFIATFKAISIIDDFVHNER